MRRRDHEEVIRRGKTYGAELRGEIDRLRGELEAERAYSRRLLEQIAGLDTDSVSDPGALTQALESMPAGVGHQLAQRPPAPAGPLPRTGTQWAMPEEPDPTTFEDPIDLNQPWDALPVETVDEPWGLSDQVPLAEPVPEGQREKIVGIAPGENPFAELGVPRDDL